MDDLKEELKKTWTNYPAGPLSDGCWKAVAARARELLAKPVATREVVEAWWRSDSVAQMVWRGDPSPYVIDCVLDALAHFAPPRQRMMAEGMEFGDWRKEILNGTSTSTGSANGMLILLDEAARVAHRLATTPAPEVDADAGAKAAAFAYLKNTTRVGDWSADQHWKSLPELSRNGWRAVAAMEKGNG